MEKKWWHDKFVYQIYPRSFKDDNNDGIGDIKGIISKLDYLHDLGVDILWITPFFKSPMEDNGYDVADYLSVDPLFGTNQDMDLLIEECRKRNMYIMMDIVANHTSSEHYWFKQALLGKDNPYRDYYIWADTPLYNMHSCFGGSAWQYDENSKQYYFHEFAKGQPDLNWENPKILDEIAYSINYWLDKGIKGIRFDVLHLIGKEIENNILAYGPTLHQKVHELYEKSYGKYDIITVGETWGDIPKALDFSLPERKELNMVFLFDHTGYTTLTPLGKFDPRPINMEDIKKILIRYQLALNDVSWNTLFVENHDLGRAINRFGSIDYIDMSAKAIATMIYMLKGTPYIYQGQEIGMVNQKIDDINEYNDVEIFGYYNEYVKEKKLLTEKQFLEACYKEARDNNRFPMQWDDSVNAGFNTGHKPWLKINPNYHDINVLKQQKDNNSILNYYKKLIKLRKSTEYKDTFVYGKFIPIQEDKENVFCYLRKDDKNEIVVIVNLKDNKASIKLDYQIDKILLNNYDKDYKDCNFDLDPYEAVVFRVK